MQTMSNADIQKKHAIYVVVTCTGTGVAKAIRVVTRKPYSHASIALDASLNELYSFSRNYKTIPLPASFNSEVVGAGTLGRFDSIPCEIYAVHLTEAQYRHLRSLIAYFCACRKQYSYSLLGLLWVKLQKERELHNKFVCSQFVAYVLEECGVALEKPACLYSPDDLRYLPGAHLVYRGELNQYYQEQHTYYSLYSVMNRAAV